MRHLLLAVVVVVANAAPAAEPVGPRLTPRLKGLLAEEMRFVNGASRDIAQALAAGDHASVARLAQAIHDSFIMKQKLTDRDRHDLQAALPAGFVELDAGFHATAAKLAGAARRHDGELQVYYYGRMLEQCRSCHGRYAADRFPGLAGQAPAGHAH